MYQLSKIKEASKIPLGTLKRAIIKFPKGSSKNKGNSFIYQKVPIETNFGKHAFEEEVGYVRIDFVEHNRCPPKIRKLDGYFRYDSEEETRLLNQIYKRETY